MVSNQAAFTKKDYPSTVYFNDTESFATPKPRSLTVDDASASTYERIVDAGFECLAKFGYSKTSMDDIAKHAKCSRATLYRLFPKGKDEIITSLVKKGSFDLLAELKLVVDSASDLREAIAKVLVISVSELKGNEALQKVIQCDPEFILPHLVFENMDAILLTSAENGLHLFTRWLDQEISFELIEWLARIVLTYFSTPKGQIKFNDEDSIIEFVKTFIEPGLTQMKLHTRSRHI